MQAAQYLTATRGFAASEARICYQRAESLCHSLSRPLLLYSALMGQWRYSLMTDKLSAEMQIAKRVHSLAREQNDSTLTMRMLPTPRRVKIPAVDEIAEEEDFTTETQRAPRSAGEKKLLARVEPPKSARPRAFPKKPSSSLCLCGEFPPGGEDG